MNAKQREEIESVRDGIQFLRERLEAVRDVEKKKIAKLPLNFRGEKSEGDIEVLGDAIRQLYDAELNVGEFVP